MKKVFFDTYVWACSLRDFDGEGILGKSFLKQLYKYYGGSFLIKSPECLFYYKDNKTNYLNKRKNINIKNVENNFFYKYIYPFVGIFFLWINFFKGKNICYINYLPLWNFFLILLLPPRTILGPITGGNYDGNINSISSLFRKYIIPFLYYINIRILFIKYKKLLFSTDMLFKYIPKRKRKYCYFNFTIINFLNLKKRKIKKDIDFLIYYRKYQTKKNSFQESIIENLIHKKYKIFIVGDRMNLEGIINKDYMPRKKLIPYLLRTKYTINGGENFYSIFALDCVSSGVKIFYNINVKPKEIFFSPKNFISLDYNSTKNSIKKIKNILKGKNKTKLKNKIFLKKKLFRKYDGYFNSYLN